MLIYHGTSESAARRALREGLKPRSRTARDSNWEDDATASAEHVYLTTCYAPYYAMCATPDDERWAVIEIDTSKLDPSLFYPDEDFLEQVTRGRQEDIERLGLQEMTMHQRTRWFRDNLEAFQASWQDSLKHLGTCCFRGEISLDAMARTSFFDASSNPLIAGMASDGLITLMNYRACGYRHRAITAWLMKDCVEAHEFDSMLALEPAEAGGVYMARLAELDRALAHQSGVEVRVT